MATNRIYLVSLTIDSRCPEVATDDARRCKAALEKEYPNSTFDCDIVEGVLGVRIHTRVYEPECSYVQERRAFAKGFMASAHLWER
jgi:hypothetical protein